MTPSQSAIPPILRHAFLAVLALWLIMPIALGGRVAQDAVPYVAAGELARTKPDEVYAARNGDLYDLRPAFATAWCEAAPPGTDCADLAVAFVAAPPVVPVTIALAALGDRGGALAMQFAAAGLLAAGMWLLWQRLAHRTSRAPQLLVATAVAATPMAMVPIGLGQTSPILFLSVCVGVGIGSRRRSAVAGLVWAAAAALKVFPAVLALILWWRRRFVTLAWGLGLLAVLSVVAVVALDVSIWDDFVRVTVELQANTTANPYNGSVDAFVVRLVGSPDSTAVTLAGRAVGLVGAGAVCWFGLRNTDDDLRWAAGSIALLLVSPLVWWHYTWVVIGALGIAVAAQRRLDDRTLAVLPAAALVSVVPSIPIGSGSSWPTAQALALIAGAVTFCVLARRAATAAVPGQARVRPGAG